ncbi:hypothetical protein SK128_026515, partial [Halocaridina rubra]
PPSKITMKGPSTVTAEKSFSIDCSTSPANPAANIYWLVQGFRVNNTHQEMIEDEGGGYVTKSKLIYKLKLPEVTQISVECQATNSASISTATNISIINVI